MKAKYFFRLFKYGLKDIYKNPVVILPSAILWAILFGISKVGGKLAYNFQTTFSNILWTIFVWVISFVVMSFIFSGLIGIGKKVKKEKPKLLEFVENGKKFWFRNFEIMFVILLISIVIGRVAHYGTFFIGKALELGIDAAQLIFVLIYFVGLIGVLIFFTFASFYLVIENLKIKASIRKSFKLVKKEYLATLSLLIAFFIILFLLNKIQSITVEAVEYLLIVPLAVLVFTRFVLESRK